MCLWHHSLTRVARFVMANAIELKLHTHVPLGDHYSETQPRHHIIPRLATRGQHVKTQKVL